MSTSTKPNIVVIGGSYVGTNFVDRIAPEVFETHHTVLLEKNSHFHHLFAFPRFAAVPLPPNKMLIPYTNAFHAAPPGSTSIVHGIAAQILPDKVVLQSGEAIPYEYLVLATGTGFVPVSSRTKAESVAIGKAIQERVREAERVVVVGGGAYGVQLATDAKEHYPSKHVTLIHSREQLMNRFHPELHNVIMKTLDAAGIEVILGQRVKVPEGGHFPLSGPSYNVELADGRLIPADVACVMLTILTRFPASAPSCASNRRSRSRTTGTPNVFAIGDVAATGANKNARSGSAQAEWSWILFRNPASPDAQPTVEYQDLSGQKGTLQGEVSMLMGCNRFWALRAPGVTDYDL
ncbi:FAD/NAD-P-binding domain-containing protein [Mycena olivaceomarginata]|nr:FAD/NAD-P-binding domain-containing protein [Mycena olivaceomarginata]